MTDAVDKTQSDSDQEQDPNKVVTQFLHDIHGEFATAIMCIGAVLDGIGGTVNPVQRMWLERAVYKCEHMVRLIKDYKSTLQMEDGTWPRSAELVDLQAAFRRVEARLMPIAHEHGVVMEFPACQLPTVQLRAPVLERLLERMYSQVVENTRPGGRVSTNIDLKDDSLTVDVWFESDEIEEAAAAGVFDWATQATVGLRIGRGYTMVFCKAAVTYLGGEIRLVPWRNRGNRIAIRVPFDSLNVRAESPGSHSDL